MSIASKSTSREQERMTEGGYRPRETSTARLSFPVARRPSWSGIPPIRKRTQSISQFRFPCPTRCTSCMHRFISAIRIFSSCNNRPADSSERIARATIATDDRVPDRCHPGASSAARRRRQRCLTPLESFHARGQTKTTRRERQSLIAAGSQWTTAGPHVRSPQWRPHTITGSRSEPIGPRGHRRSNAWRPNQGRRRYATRLRAPAPVRRAGSPGVATSAFWSDLRACP